MENTVPLNFVTWLLGFLIVLLGGCWGIFKYFESKLNRVYDRLDENKESYYREFVSIKVYESEQRARKENIDLRFIQQVELFSEKIESLKHEIRSLVSAAAAAAEKRLDPYTKRSS